MAVVYVKLIAVLVQHWILLTATWCECRRSLMKAAAIIADWVTLLIDALDDLDRLIAILSRMKDVLLKAGARVQNRNIHPSRKASPIPSVQVCLQWIKGNPPLPKSRPFR